VGVYLLALYWPFAADFFQLTPLSPTQWGRVLAVAAPAFVLTLASDWAARLVGARSVSDGSGHPDRGASTPRSRSGL
jgi:hypothetical protein